MNKALVFFACAVAGVAINMFMACGPIVRKNCGAYRVRATDGASCRECVDATGRYAECGMRVLEKR